MLPACTERCFARPVKSATTRWCLKVVAQTVQNTGWKPMLHWAVASSTLIGPRNFMRFGSASEGLGFQFKGVSLLTVLAARSWLSATSNIRLNITVYSK